MDRKIIDIDNLTGSVTRYHTATLLIELRDWVKKQKNEAMDQAKDLESLEKFIVLKINSLENKEREGKKVGK